MTKEIDLTFEELSETFKYNPDNGEITRIKSSKPVCIGKIISAISHGYITIGYNGKNLRGHRLAWLLYTGEWPKEFIDHINGNRADNRISNLREATNQENQENQIKPHSNNTTGFLGVSKYNKSGKFIAHIRISEKLKSLGVFNTPEEASEAYLTAKRKYHEFNTL